MDLAEAKVLEFRAAVLSLYLVIAAGACLAVVPTYYYVGINLLTLACIAYSGVVVATALSFRRGALSLNAASRWFLGATVAACMTGLYLGSETVDNKPWQLLIPVAAFTVAGSREGRVWTIASLLLATLVLVLRGPAYNLSSSIVLLVAYATTACALDVFNRHNENNIRTIAHLSHTDSLTGTYNRTLFEQLSLNQFNRSLRAGEALAVYMIDIDHFKQFNDRYGHVAGDRALAEVGEVLRTTARRASDLVFRYGGEEFCIVSAAIDVDEANALADKIIEGVRALGIRHALAERGTLTVSIGLSHQDKLDGTSVALMLQQADRALYAAKSAGRDTLVRYPLA